MNFRGSKGGLGILFVVRCGVCVWCLCGSTHPDKKINKNKGGEPGIDLHVKIAIWTMKDSEVALKYF